MKTEWIYKTTPEATQKYWVSWYSGGYDDEGCTEPPFEYWLTGQLDRDNSHLPPEKRLKKNGDEKDLATWCGFLIANSVEEVWAIIAKHYPDYRERFCSVKDANFDPREGGRFS